MRKPAADMTPPLIKVENLTRIFDVSKPWLNRIIERDPRHFLRAVDNVTFEIRKFCSNYNLAYCLQPIEHALIFKRASIFVNHRCVVNGLIAACLWTNKINHLSLIVLGREKFP